MKERHEFKKKQRQKRRKKMKQKIKRKKMDNDTDVVYFLLLGFHIGTELQIFFFIMFLSIYILTLTANISIITLVKLDQHLHTPMYQLLSHLSFLEIFYTSSIVPTLLPNLLQKNIISLPGCLAQTYFYFSLGTTEFFLLGVMAVDRYLAICNPLRYTNMMNGMVCLQATAVCWLVAFLSIFVPVIMLSKLYFCGPYIINHFFCDVAPLLKLSCSDTHIMESAVFILACFTILPSFLVTIISYVFIIVTILRSVSKNGKQKAFSTCSSHFTVVVILYGTVIFIYVRPAFAYPVAINKFIGVFNTVITPLLNPLIYCLRNKEVKASIRKQFGRTILRNNMTH
ncbi:olfactory receptor 6F1-like [Pleurodeles waltl]|uniref:olfactory receptor 6F1-like n=1 Tax=Pleurodeles waltl TaxID=8319 RepID=UPI003709BD52